MAKKRKDRNKAPARAARTVSESRAQQLFISVPRKRSELRRMRIPLLPAQEVLIPGSARTRANKVKRAVLKARRIIEADRSTPRTRRLRTLVQRNNDFGKPEQLALASSMTRFEREHKPADVSLEVYRKLCAKRKARRQALMAAGKVNRPGGAPGPYKQRGPRIKCP